MKTLLFALATLAAASLLSSCKQDGGSINGPGTALPLKSSPPPANPAIAYYGTNSNGKYIIEVMDTDASNQTAIITAASTTELLAYPTWSPTAGSISYLDGATNSNVAAIKAADVSVNSKGVPVASNIRSIFTNSTSDTASISTPAWSSVSSTGEIAFVRNHQGSKLGLAELCIVSTSGGSATVLQSASGLNSSGTVQKHYLSPSWSPDDSRIAVVRRDTSIAPNGTTNICTILIIDPSTGTATDSIKTTMYVSWLEWSRSGMNELALTAATSSGSELYYVTPSTGSTIAGNGIANAGSVTWSPNNSSVLTQGHATNYLVKVTPFTTSTSNVESTAWGYWKWKQ
jgi:hypothetical protein